MDHLLGLKGGTFSCGASEMKAHQTQALFLTSVACLDGKICDNGQKKVHSPVAMETSSSFFLFLFLLFLVNELLQSPAGWQPERLQSSATAQGRPSQKQGAFSLHVLTKVLFSVSNFFFRNSSAPQEE